MFAFGFAFDLVMVMVMVHEKLSIIFEKHLKYIDTNARTIIVDQRNRRQIHVKKPNCILNERRTTEEKKKKSENIT